MSESESSIHPTPVGQPVNHQAPKSGVQPAGGTLSTNPSAGLHRMLQFDQHWVDRLATWVADRCSPILVKESRQAMKSWQFQWTFLLLLLAVVIWSLLGISMSIYNSTEETGAEMLAGYMWILGFPLAVVLPLASFRSLAREFEDETIQLISITTMSARRIVLGKLGSAGLQLALYLAAVVPCIAFSYLLRGVDFAQISHLLLLAISGSLGLTGLALMLAGFGRLAWLRILLNLVLIAGLGFVYFFWCMFNSLIATAPIPGEGYLAFWFFSIFFLSFGYLGFECAASLISFASENCSTRIRMALSFQIVACLATLFAMLLADRSGTEPPLAEIVPWIAIWVSHYICIVGAMIVSEQPGLSQRVRRELPHTTLGRVTWGLYMPGPGRGFLFVLTMLWFWNLAFAVFLFNFTGPWLGIASDPADVGTAWAGIWVNVVYGTAFLCASYTFMCLLGRWIRYARVFVGLLFLAIAYILPLVVGVVADAFVFGGVPRYQRGFSLLEQWNWGPAFYQAVETNVADLLLMLVIYSGVTLGWSAIAIGLALREWVTPPSLVPQRVLAELKRQQAQDGVEGETFEKVFQQRHSTDQPT